MYSAVLHVDRRFDTCIYAFVCAPIRIDPESPFLLLAFGRVETQQRLIFGLPVL